MMLKWKFSFLFCLFGFIFSGCSLFAKSKPPYLIDAEMVMDESQDYEIAGLNFDFYNREDKKVKGFTMVFYLYDCDGNPVSIGKSNIVINVTIEVDAGERTQGCISMDQFLFEYPEEPYQVDYLYISKIEYEDESVWTDPFGLSVF